MRGPRIGRAPRAQRVVVRAFASRCRFTEVRRALCPAPRKMISHPRLSSWTVLAAFLALLAGCSSASNSPQGDGGPTEAVARVDVARDPLSGVAPGDVDLAVAANNAFAVDLYTRLEADAGTENALVSPISASLALTMAYAGAVGQTATEMATALHFGPDAGSSIFDGQNALDQTLTGRGAAALASVVQNNAQVGAQIGVDAAAPSPSDYELQIVNSVWGEKTYTWSTPFLTIMAKSYGAGV